jgi:MFS family permease
VNPAYRGWVLAAGVYLLAVFNRSSLGVAGLIAEHRFGIGPGALSTFVLLQIGVYAAMQIPTGLLVDRYGPRRLLIAAATILGVAQLAFAFVHIFALALLARALLGLGDALTFVSTLRYTATHFSAKRYPLLVALTAVMGTVGNVAATLPLNALLRGAGWTTGFLVAAIASLAGAVGVALLVHDPTPLPTRIARARLGDAARTVGRRVRAAWAVPGTKLGFWVHFTCMAAATPLMVLWGQPYLVQGVGFTPAAASTLLMIGVIVSGLANPVVGALIGHWPATRIPIGLGVSGGTVVALLVIVLALGDHPPKPVVGTIFVLMLIGAPASMAAFAVARDYNSYATLGTASGVVNVGGFAATSFAAVVFGLVLDAQGGAGPHAMRVALLVLVAVQAFGLSQLALWYRRVRAEVMRRQLAGDKVPVRVPRRMWFDVRDLEGPAATR